MRVLLDPVNKIAFHSFFLANCVGANSASHIYDAACLVARAWTVCCSVRVLALAEAITAPRPVNGVCQASHVALAPSILLSESYIYGTCFFSRDSRRQGVQLEPCPSNFVARCGKAENEVE